MFENTIKVYSKFRHTKGLPYSTTKYFKYSFKELLELCLLKFSARGHTWKWMHFKTITNLTTISHHLWVSDMYLPWAISQNEPIASHQCTILISYAFILKAYLKEFVFERHFDLFFPLGRLFFLLGHHMVSIFLKFKTRHAYFNFIFKMILLITKFLVFFCNNHWLCIRIDFQIFALKFTY
jgi:hypothetical protein